MDGLFYTEEQREKLRDITEDANARHRPLSEAMGAAILDALGEQQNTMLYILGEIKRINDSESRTQKNDVGRSKIERFIQSLPEKTITEIEKALKSTWG